MPGLVVTQIEYLLKKYLLGFAFKINKINIFFML